MKPSRRGRWRGAFWGAVALAAAIACGGRSNGNGPFVGGESHFLYRCVSSCDDGLECISGVCTKPCIVDESDCSGLASGALCTNESVEPGAVAICDLACADDGDCSALGGEHGCNLGFCRAPAQPPSSAGTGGAAAGTGGTNAAGAAQGAQGGSSGGAMPGGAGRGGSGGSVTSTGGGAGTGGAAGAAAGAGGVAGASAGSSSSAGQSCETTLIASPEQNYEYASSMSVSTVLVKPSAELMLDWSGVTTDFRGRAVDLGTVDMVEIAQWEMTPETFVQELNDDVLANPIVIMAIMTRSNATSGSIFDAEVPSGPLDQTTILAYLNAANYPPADHVYSVMVATGTEYGKGTYMLGAFQLDPASDNTTVNVTSTSTQLDYSATIASRPATYVPAGVGALNIDWTNMTVTAAGGTFIPNSITQLRIGSYTQSAAELEGEFAHLDELAVEMYEAPVDVGTTLSLDRAKTSDGKQFAGIDDTHTWLLALNCGACQNPAPWYLTVLKPCAGGP